MQTTYTRAKYKRGFTMFFAVLVASLALGIGVAIYDLVVRELLLSYTTEQSQYAIYAADTGAECALYWDAHYDINGVYGLFATSSTDTMYNTGGPAMCNGVDVAAQRIMPPTTTIDSAFSTTSLVVGTNYYAVVAVIKKKNASTGNVDTTIYSHGYNSNILTSPRIVERVLRIDY